MLLLLPRGLPCSLMLSAATIGGRLLNIPRLAGSLLEPICQLEARIEARVARLPGRVPPLAGLSQLCLLRLKSESGSHTR